MQNIDLSWYPNLPEKMTEGKTEEEIEKMKSQIRDHMVSEIFKEEKDEI